MKTKKGFNLREICGEHVVLAQGIENIDFNNVIAMNETSAFIWEHIAGKDFTVEDMVNCLMDEYEVDKETATRDCQALADQWFEAGIINK